jgi:plasmid maintenance system antidote protein VapI
MSLQANYDLWHALQKVKHIKRIAPGEPFPVREKA